ncbi:MAG: 50S ribosomal protein L25/general stress protein Ctc [Gemmatimonadaceae bacterium]
MATATLSATPRPDTGKGAARTLRRAGKVPAVLYGHARAATSVAIETRELEKLLDKIAAASTVIELSVDGKMARTLIREIQRHPYRQQIIHVDFQELVAGERVTVRLPIVYIGVPEGVRASGGVLDQILHDLEVEVDPASIPNHVDVEVGALQIGDSIHVRDLKLPAGVAVLNEPAATLCVVSAPRAAIETPVSVAAVEAPAEPELIRKTKDDEEGEETK